MKVLGAILFFTISSNSFAGLFCESLKCDLKISEYSDRVLSSSTETRDIKIPKIVRIAEIQQNGAPQEYALAQKEALKKISDNNDEVNKVFNQPGVRVKSCTAKGVEAPPEVTIHELSSEPLLTTMMYTTTISATCSIVILDKKNPDEMAKSLCLRAIQCASNIDSTDKLASYIKLKDGLCGKNFDSILPTAGIDSSGRSSKKENADYEGGSYGSPANTTSK